MDKCIIIISTLLYLGTEELLVLFNELLKALNTGSHKFANLIASLVEEECGHGRDAKFFDEVLHCAKETLE